MGALIIILFKKKKKQPTWNRAVEYVLAIMSLRFIWFGSFTVCFTKIYSIDRLLVSTFSPLQSK